MSESLKQKATKGVVWQAIDKLANYGISFIVGVILARLLSPNEYGLIGIITIFITLFNIVLDSGFSTSLIRKKNANEDDYNTVFIINIVLSCFLTGLLFFCSPFIASYFSRPELIPLIKVMSFILVINALSIIQQVQLTRKVDFKSQTKVAIISNVLSGIIGITSALLGFKVWALVFHHMTSRVISSILFWIYNKWIPRFRFSFSSFRQLFSFGWKYLISCIIDSLFGQLYQVVIGKYYSPSTLGQYTRAQQYSSLCSTTIGIVIMKVSLPVLSSIQDDNEHLLRVYRQIIKKTMYVTFILMFGMAACSKSLILVLIGDKWVECIPYLQLLCLQMVLYPLHLININLILVQGRSDVQLYLQIIKTILAIGPLLLGVYVGIYWMLWGSIFVSCISFFLNSYYSGKSIGYTSFMQICDVFPCILIATIMIIPVGGISFLPINIYLMLPFQVLIGIVMIIFLSELFKIEEYLFFKNIILNKIKK